jgi:hypothetical protein
MHTLTATQSLKYVEIMYKAAHKMVSTLKEADRKCTQFRYSIL